MNTPEIGHWYRLTVNRDPVEVVALDDNETQIELEHFDGEIESLDHEQWLALEPVEVSAPEDWSGPFEMDRQDVNHEQLFQDYQRPTPLIKSD
ncbi:MAG: DUF6763 family protein [Kangiellaceae bacterium]|jgi:hypothetical protein|nr:DUF6763 family protein [Kangiellaceae bacterium]